MLVNSANLGGEVMRTDQELNQGHSLCQEFKASLV